MKTGTRLATVDDIFKISKLYFDVYDGTYTDPMMKNFSMMREFIRTPGCFWFVTEVESQIIASVLARYDESNLVAKAYGAVVSHDFRRKNIMEELLGWGLDYIRDNTKGLDVIYSTTRTVNEAAQSLTENLGFKKLGIFPNAHKTNDYETHCLTAIITPAALAKRRTDYLLHHVLRPFFDLVKAELSLPDLQDIVPTEPTKVLVGPDELELIEAPKFVSHRYKELKSAKALEFEFFPFHEPTMMIMSPNQEIELFCHMSDTDGYCAITGGKMSPNMNYTELFLRANKMLRDYGARYIEIIVRADRPKILESMMNAKFIPCAFFPAFQASDEKRFDFFVFSRTFEVFDFQNVKLKGLNQRFLEEYFKAWKKRSLNPKLIDV